MNLVAETKQCYDILLLNLTFRFSTSTSFLVSRCFSQILLFLGKERTLPLHFRFYSIIFSPILVANMVWMLFFYYKHQMFLPIISFCEVKPYFFLVWTTIVTWIYLISGLFAVKSEAHWQSKCRKGTSTVLLIKTTKERKIIIT